MRAPSEYVGIVGAKKEKTMDGGEAAGGMLLKGNPGDGRGDGEGEVEKWVWVRERWKPVEGARAGRRSASEQSSRLVEVTLLRMELRCIVA